MQAPLAVRPCRRFGMFVWCAGLLVCLIVLAITCRAADKPMLDERTSEQWQARVLALNGDIFWAPASGFTGEDSWPNIFGDEARSVFGPIPAIDCTSGVALHAEVNGNRVDVESLVDGGIAFVHRSGNGQVTEVSRDLPHCDKPSLANTAGHPCAVNTRLVRLTQPRSPFVDWVALCRKSELGPALTSSDSYWSEEDRRFALLGIIGFNRASGEVVFFDGTDLTRGGRRLTTFDASAIFPPPGASGYHDYAGRVQAADIYFTVRRISCETCHDNKEPWIVTPHLKVAVVGYRDEVSRRAFATENILPLVQPRSDTDPYRVIGSRFTRLADLSSKTFRDPSGQCTNCHTLTTDWTGNVLAFDAVGKQNPREPYNTLFRKIDRARTPWSKEWGNIHPWMTPVFGPRSPRAEDNIGRPSAIDDQDWQRIVDCIEGHSQEECHYQPAYTTCPAPETSTMDCEETAAAHGGCPRIFDPFGPTELSVELSPFNPVDAPGERATRLATLRWTYHNGLGQVPRRDDVRFNVAVYETDLVEPERLPDLTDFPRLERTMDPFHDVPGKRGKVHYCDFGSTRLRTCNVADRKRGRYFFNNVSYLGHWRNTTPNAVDGPREYQLRFDAACDKQHLVRVLPKRYCFDRSGVVPGRVDHVIRFDVACP